MRARESFLDKLFIRDKIYLALILVIVVLTSLFGVLIFFYFQSISKNYHENRLARKEKNIIETIDYLISEFPQNVTEENVKDIFENNIYKYSDINDIHINIYDLKGELLISSQSGNSKDIHFVPGKVMQILSLKNDRVEMVQKSGKNTYIRIYSYLYNINHQPIAIINLPYLHDDSYQKDEFYDLLIKFLVLVSVIMIVGLVISYWLSKSIASRLDEIAEKLVKTDVVKLNRPLQYRGKDEISPLVNSYNNMLVKLNEQSELLLKLEREETWREAAKQVAHELKNPLTPMRLQMQSFQRKFDKNLPDIEERVKDFTESMINQIDVIDRISQAFSDYTKMPVRKDQKIDVCEEVEKTLDIFDEEMVSFHKLNEPIYIYYDPTYLSRIVTNLVKNSMQAVPFGTKPQIEVTLMSNQEVLILKIKDNGTGVSDEVKDKLFEPKFTTKSSGSGLGLPVVKKMIEEYNGSIKFENNIDKGVTFTIQLPLRNK
ncbi:histidine kinase [Candidatus Ornithobacterium hominis]|uniref:sensor histidine kinase n=1 Tax=Candidatus Ornithobacterium hominis TaxID=2497989 RepID=UPI0024BCA970|nr:HAMP domain-containing sensor histidine kinase [Candidatus Ornithobacterium hominis]CAI9429217.1 histidine kinase [Candidatus Ornithobacterium hominis]